MRRASLAVLITLLALLGPPAVASASDAGLKALVTEQRAGEKAFVGKLEAASKRIGEPRSFAQSKRRIARYLRTTGRLLGQQRAATDGFRRRFAAEGPETPEADRGRTLVLLGLRDTSQALALFRAQVARVGKRLTRVRTPGALAGISDQLEPTGRADRLGTRGDDRTARGRKLIRSVPAPAPPAPPVPAA